MNRTESWEMEISALLDAELSHGEILEVVDELVDSESARGFYRQGRQLDRLLTAGDSGRATLPPHLWERIEGASGAPARGTGTGIRRGLRLVAMAAAAVLLIGVGWLLAPGGTVPQLAEGPVLSGDVVTVSLTGSAGSMTDERFLSLTTELLQADPRYHHKMKEIMDAVADHTVPAEGSGEGLRPLTDGGGDLVLAADRSDRRWD